MQTFGEDLQPNLAIAVDCLAIHHQAAYYNKEAPKNLTQIKFTHSKLSFVVKLRLLYFRERNKFLTDSG